MLPELGQIGPFVIRTYTLLLDLGILAGLGVLTWHGWQTEDKAAEWIDTGLGALVGGLIFGRAGHVAIYWSYFAEHPGEIAQIWLGGIDWHAAMMGGLIGLWIMSVVRGVLFRPLTDVLSFVLPIEAILIYAGCLSTSCGHGREVPSLAGYPPLVVMELPDLYGVAAPRFTTQLFGMALGLLLLTLSLVLARMIRRRGVRFWIVLAALGLGAFGIGFARGDEIRMVGWLRLDQALDLTIVLIGLLGTLIAARSGGKLAPAVAPARR